MSVQVDNNTSTAIPDNDPAGVDLTYVVSGAADCTRVRFSVYLTHDAPGDLLLDLQHPDGSTVRLFDKVDGGGADLGTSSAQDDRALFSSGFRGASAIASVNSAAANPRRFILVGGVFVVPDPGQAPFVRNGGRPWEPSYPYMWRSFARKPADGTWTLTIVDTGSGTTGTHHNSSLFID